MKKLNVMILLAISVICIRCSKNGKQETENNGQAQEFVQSAVYKDFLRLNHPPGKMGVDQARIVPINKTAAIVHIPVMDKKNVAGAVIGLPSGKGQYELLYQDNREALSGSGRIYLYTAAHELFGTMGLQNGKVRSFDTENMAGGQTGEGMRVNCGFLCELNKCYAAVKAKFPGDPICRLLDIFYGVCTSATITTCLIRMAAR